MLVHIHIDFEVQNNYRPSDPPYPVIKRGIYYGAREISSQLGILTEQTDYGKIERYTAYGFATRTSLLI